MTANVGTVDRAFRLILGILLIVAPFANIPDIWDNTALFYGAIVVGLVLAVTSVFKFCPLYRILGMSTCRM